MSSPLQNIPLILAQASPVYNLGRAQMTPNLPWPVHFVGVSPYEESHHSPDVR